MLGKIALGVVAVLVAAVLYIKLTAVRVPPDDARQLVAAGAVLLDVRTKGEYGDGGIEGSVNIPIQELPMRMDELGEKNQPIVVYCQSGGRSAMAKQLLEGNGFTKVHDLGSIRAW